MWHWKKLPQQPMPLLTDMARMKRRYMRYPLRLNGSASILLISYAYIKMLGAERAYRSTKYAILNCQLHESEAGKIL